MMISPNNIRIGSLIRCDNRILRIKDKTHVKLDKSGACQKMQCEDIFTHSHMEMRLNVKDNIEEVFVTTKTVQFLYADNNVAFFMDQDECEMIELPFSQISMPGLANLLTHYDVEKNEPIDILLQFISIDDCDKCIGCQLVSDIILEITETNPSIKGESVTSSYKPALASGVSIKVPSHVKIKDKVLLSKEDFTYVRKV
jgi:elongation factor P